MSKYGWHNETTLFKFGRNSEVTIKLFDNYFEVSKERNVIQISYYNYLISVSYWNVEIEQNLGIKLSDYFYLNEFLKDLITVIKSIDSVQNTIPKRYLTKSGKNFIDILKNEMLADEEFKGFVKGCMLKYIFRYENKGGLEDLKKADNYLKMLEDIERGNKK